jgi:hypothetical protein
MAHESDAASLLDELRRDTELDDELERDALARVERRLLLRVIEGGGGEQPEARRSRTEQARRVRWWRGARGGMAAALLVGSALGAGGHAAVSFVVSRGLFANVAPKPAAPENAGDSATVEPSERRPRGGEATAATVLEVAVTPSVDVVALPLNPQPAQPRAPAASAGAAASLELELSELEVARRAVAKGDGATSLRTLLQHTQRYPGSVLTQERDALTVKALVLSARYDEARALGADFRARHPKSMLLDSVERALASIP